MDKLVYCVRKLPALSDQAFFTYWLDNHGPLVRRFANAIRAEEYVQSHTVATPVNALLQQARGLQEPYDGITEVWFNDIETIQKVFADPSAREALQQLIEDESTFVDFSKSQMFVTDEHSIF